MGNLSQVAHFVKLFNNFSSNFTHIYLRGVLLYARNLSDLIFL